MSGVVKKWFWDPSWPWEADCQSWKKRTAYKLNKPHHPLVQHCTTRRCSRDTQHSRAHKRCVNAIYVLKDEVLLCCQGALKFLQMSDPSPSNFQIARTESIRTMPSEIFIYYSSISLLLTQAGFVKVGDMAEEKLRGNFSVISTDTALKEWTKECLYVTF